MTSEVDNMKESIRRIAALALAGIMAVSEVPGLNVQAEKRNDEGKREELTFAVMSDTHYFPTEYNGTRAEAYQDQTSGDLRLMGEGQALTEGAVDQLLAKDPSDYPDILLVTGDLSSEGELASHEGFASQMKRLEDAGIAVFVIPGNHDLYNYSAMSFRDDTKVSGTDLYTTLDQFKEIYADYGYGSEEDQDNYQIEYYADEYDAEGTQGGLSYILHTNGFALLMLDSEVYTKDVNGSDTDRGTGDGMICDQLLEWILEKTEEAQENGETVIASMHHPLLVHNTTQETEFITDTVAGNEELAETLADAGIRYIFTGHMHENDIASYTTVEGNTIYDMETGGMVAYGSPIRMITMTKNADGTEQMTIDTESVKEAAMNAKLDAPNGNITDTEKVDVLEYELNAMYGENFVSNLIFRYADRYLDQFTDIPAALQNIAGIDLYSELFKLLPSLLSGEMTVDLGGSIGTLVITYSSSGTFQDGDGVHLNPASGVAGLLGSFTVRDADIQTEVGHVLDQVEEQYMANGVLKEKLDGIIVKAKNTVLETEESHTLYDLLQYMFTVHNTGKDTEGHPDWVQRSLDNLAAGPLLQETVMDIINNDIYPFIDELIGTITIDLDTLFGRNALWSTAVNAVMGSSNPTLATVLDKFGVDVKEILNGLLNEYLSDSFFTSVGGLAVNMINGFAADDDGLDDVVDGEAVTLTYDGQLHPNFSVENGMLPNQVTVSLGGNDTKGVRNFSWYTGTKIESGEVQLLEATPGMTVEEAETAFESGEGVITTGADTATVNKAKLKLNLVLVTTYDIEEANRHTAEVSIEEEKNYYYRVGTTYGDTACYSEPVLLGETSPADDDSFTFINVADSQGATESDYNKYLTVLGQAEETFEDAEFITHLGDFVDDGNNESYWDWVLNNEEMQSLPVVPVAGNHEARATDERLLNAIAAHYNVDIPEQDTSQGIYYSFTYENATFIVLNTNDINDSDQISEAQMTWARSVAQNAQTTWKILLTHKAPYSKGPHYNDSDVIQIRQQLDQLTADCDIDLVLSGHDHTYLRTPWLLNGQAQQTDYTDLSVDGITYRTAINPEGTVFVIPSTSGVKYYEFNETADVPAEVAGQPYMSVYEGITVEGDTLYYRAYTEDGSLYDSFAIQKGEEQVSAVQQVVNMIEEFRDGVTLEDEAAVIAARKAYNALTAEEQGQVTNLDVLIQAEKMIQTLKDIAGKETVKVSDKDAFLAALANENVGTIEVDAKITIGGYNNVFSQDWSGQWQSVSHDVVIRGVDTDAQLERVGLVVENNATLILDDMWLYANHRDSSSRGEPLNCVEVKQGNLYVNGNTRIEQGTNGSCDCDTTHGLGTNKQHGHAIALTGTGNVYINTTGNITGKYEAVYSSTDTESNVVIQNGNFSSAGGDAVIACQYDLEINGGTINSSSNDYPLVIGGTAYMTGGTVGNNGSGGAIQLKDNADLHIRPASSVTINGTAVSLGTVETADSKNVSVDVDTQKFGENQTGTIYALPTNTLQDFRQIADNTEGALGTTLEEGTLKAALTEKGLNYVYGKYQATGGSLMNSISAGSNARCWIYNQYQRVYNVPVDSVTVAAEHTIAGVDGTLKLNASTMPSTALDNKITWASDNTEVAKVDGSGTVTGLKSGTAVITATAPSGAEDKITVYICAPQIEGSDTITKDQKSQNYQLTGLEGLPENISVKWTLEDNTLGLAVSSDGTVSRTGNTQAGTVTLKGTVYENGKQTSAVVAKEISVEANLVTSVEIQGGGQAVIKDEDADPFRLTADILPAGAMTGNVTWTSSNDAAASVDEAGMVSVNGVGSAVITASADGQTDSVMVVVPKLTGSSLAYVGQENVICELRGAEALPGVKISYSVDDKEKAEISDSGEMTLLKEGEVTVTAKVVWDSDGKNPQEFTRSRKLEILENEDMYLARLAEEKMMALPAADDITLENKDQVAEAVAEAASAYEMLTEAQKGYVSQEAVTKLEEAEKALARLNVTDAEKAEAERISAAIEALPDPVTLEDEDDVAVIRTDYDKLTEDGKHLVGNYEKLLKAEEQIAKLKADAEADAEAASAVEKLIQALPEADSLTLEDKDAVNEAAAAYEDLTDAQKALVSKENTEKLEAALEKIAGLEQTEADKEAADEVDQMILALPDEIAIADEKEVAAARAAYESLTTEQKQYVEELERLEQAEEAIAELKAADQEAAREVIDAIDAFGEEISLEDKAALEAVKAQYDELTDSQKGLVTNYGKLQQMLDQIARLEQAEKDKAAAAVVEKLIDALPDEITLQDEASVNAARTAYNGLTEGQRAYVGNLDKLLQAEKSIIDLKGDGNNTGNNTSTGNIGSNGQSGAGTGGGENESGGAVQTGDYSLLLLWFSLMLAGAAGITGILYFKRKRRY